MSDRIDTDDDGDGIADQNDPFARDPNNGRATKLPVSHEWENDSESAGFLFNLGFSGLMNNGSSEYLDLYSLENLTTGGAAGVLTIDDIPDGDPINVKNSQAYAFQFGIDVTSTTAPFTVHTRLLTPFAGADIGGRQSMGFYIGTGDQDSYIKLVMNSTGLTGGVQFAAERNGIFQQVANVAAPVFGQEEVDLYLSLDPAAGTVRAFYRSGTDDEIVEVGSATALPKAWLEADSGLAIGIIATSLGGPTFGATWDFIRVTNGVTGTTTTETTTVEDTNDESVSSAGDVNTAVNGLIAIEAEHAVDNVAAASRSWVSGSRSGARGNASMITSPDTGLIRLTNSDTPHLRYQVNFPEAGSWRVWVRGWGDAVGNEGKSDSVHVGLDGALAGAASLQGFPAGGWAWSNTTRGNGVATVQVSSAGQHTIDVWMREDGLKIDALLLTTDTDYVPDGALGNGSSDTESNAGSGNPDDQNGSGTDDQSRASNTRDWVKRSSADGSSATKRHEAGAVEFDGKLFLLGGRGDRPVDIYDPATKRWRKGAAAPFEMHHFQPVVLNKKIWVVGAMTCCFPREDNISHVWTYTPATNLWEQGAEIPEARRRGSASTVVRDGKIYLAGGNTLGHDGGAVGWFDEFDPSNGVWRKLPDAPVARDHAQGGLIDDWLVLAAGRRSARPNVFLNTIARVDVYDFTTGTWSRGADIPTTRAGTMAVTVGREILVIGGESAGRTAAHDAVEAYDVDTDHWRTLRPLQQGRHSGAAVRLDDGVHVAAGATRIGGSSETASHESLIID